MFPQLLEAASPGGALGVLDPLGAQHSQKSLFVVAVCSGYTSWLTFQPVGAEVEWVNFGVSVPESLTAAQRGAYVSKVLYFSGFM